MSGAAQHSADPGREVATMAKRRRPCLTTVLLTTLCYRCKNAIKWQCWGGWGGVENATARGRMVAAGKMLWHTVRKGGASTSRTERISARRQQRRRYRAGPCCCRCGSSSCCRRCCRSRSSSCQGGSLHSTQPASQMGHTCTAGTAWRAHGMGTGRQRPLRRRAETNKRRSL